MRILNLDFGPRGAKPCHCEPVGPPPGAGWAGPDWDRPEVDGRGSRLGRPGCLISLQAEVPAVEAEAPYLIGRRSEVGR